MTKNETSAATDTGWLSIDRKTHQLDSYQSSVISVTCLKCGEKLTFEISWPNPSKKWTLLVSDKASIIAQCSCGNAQPVSTIHADDGKNVIVEISPINSND